MTNTNIQSTNSKFNPLNTTILDATIEEKDGTYQTFFKTISENLNIEGKSKFMVCRDIYSAKIMLRKPMHLKSDGTPTLDPNGEPYYNYAEYEQLIKDLKISESTERKYLSIGKYAPLEVAYFNGTLPKAWTVQFFLSTLSYEDFEKVKPMLNVNTTEREIKKELGIKKPKPEPKPNYEFAKLELNKEIVNSRKDYDKFESSLNKFLEKNPQLICSYSNGLRHKNWSLVPKGTLDKNMKEAA
jgi:hypothetical protein